MELRHLRYFVAIAEEGGIGRAAARLRVAQPALSRQLRDLEEELGGALCERGPSGVTLTRAGKLLLRRARAVLNAAGNMVEEVRAVNGLTEERLAVGFLSNHHLDHLKPALAAFQKARPRLELEFLQDMQAGQLAALRERRIDVAFVNLPASLDGLEHETALRVPLVAVLPPGHRLLQKRAVRLTDLTDEPFVFCTRESRPEFYDFVRARLLAAGARPRAVRELGGALDGVVGLVKLGLGLSVLPLYRDAPRAYGVRWRPFVKPAPFLEFALVWRAGDSSPLPGEFMECVRSALPPLGRKPRVI